MRIIKLTPKKADEDNPSIARIYYNQGNAPAFHLGPDGQFESNKKIGIGQLDAGEPLAFFYEKELIYIADAKSEVERNDKWGSSGQYFCVNEKTIEVGDGSMLHDVQKQLGDEMGDKTTDIINTRGSWIRVEMKHDRARKFLQQFVDKQAKPNVKILNNKLLTPTPLEEKAKRLLTFLVSQLENVVVGSPETYTTYGDCLNYLGVSELTGRTYGDVLGDEGLVNLANWIKENDLPAITGLIVSKDSREPGKGYYRVYGKDSYAFSWWREEIEKSKNFDWSSYVEVKKTSDTKDGNAGRKASDINEPPERVKCETLRIIRDTRLSQEIKELNDYTCQLCRKPLFINEDENIKYAEAHHIQPLGKPHNGLDVAENMICVCPNCHALLDQRAITLPAKIDGAHEIGQEYIDYHNDKIYKKI